MTDETLGYRTCVALFPGTILHDLYDEYGSRLLELNVRSYLQARGKVNKGILETLVREPHRFLAYNNGITIVAEGIDFSNDKARVLSIKGMQIVNGGQTTASIHRAMKDSKVDISHVYVQAKLTVVPPEAFDEMVPDISRFSNTQNKVSEVDLRANHAYHVGIERVSRRVWAPGEQSMWFYERARGSYQTERAKRGGTASERQKFDKQFPASQRFTKEDLARYTNAWDGLPHIVSRGGPKELRTIHGKRAVRGEGVGTIPGRVQGNGRKGDSVSPDPGDRQRTRHPLLSDQYRHIHGVARSRGDCKAHQPSEDLGGAGTIGCSSESDPRSARQSRNRPCHLRGKSEPGRMVQVGTVLEASEGSGKRLGCPG